MGKQLAITENGVHLVGKKLYVTAKTGVVSEVSMTVEEVDALSLSGGVFSLNGEVPVWNADTERFEFSEGSGSRAWWELRELIDREAGNYINGSSFCWIPTDDPTIYVNVAYANIDVLHQPDHTAVYQGQNTLCHRKAKKAYLTIGGVHRLIFSGGVDVATMSFSYSGDMTDGGVVTFGDPLGEQAQYRLLILTSSGTLTVDAELEAEVWMCGGGTSGQASISSYAMSGGGGAGAYTTTGAVKLSGKMAAVVGAGGAKSKSNGAYNGGGASSFAGLSTKSIASDTSTEKKAKAISGGTGGGSGTGGGGSAGAGDGINKVPFRMASLDSTLMQGHYTCAGGGGGGYYNPQLGGGATGGSGGTNGANGGAAIGFTGAGGVGGSYGGGNGGDSGFAGSDATYYGSGGGGAGFGAAVINSGGAGYQGVIYIRIPVNQGGVTPEPTMISFTIGGTTYQAEEGMTWAEWCDSQYDTYGYVVQSDNKIYSDNGFVVLGAPNDALGYSFASDTLVANAEYAHILP